MTDNTPDQDAKLLANGYEAIACLGKAPVSAGWQAGAITPKRVAAERIQFPDAVSTGLRTGALVGIDLDVVNWTHALKLRDVAQSLLGETPLRRKGAKGAMLLYRNATPIKKITVTSERPKEAKVEILGSGQQLVAFGVHPDTGKPYQWAGTGTPLSFPFSSLPVVNPDQLRALAAILAAELTTLGYGAARVTGDIGEEAKPAKIDSSGAPVAERVLRAALSYLDPNAEREEWRNIIAGIHAAPLVDDENGDKARTLALEWSRGELDRLERYQIDPPNLYTGDDAVLAVFDTMPPKEQGIKVGSVFEAAKANGWNGNPYSDGKTASEAFEKALGGLPPPKQTTNGKLLRSVSFADLMARPSAPIEEIIPGLIEKRIATMLAGHGGTHKSRFAQQLGLSIQAGVPIFGKITESCTFVYLDYENGEAEITRRTQKMRARLKLPDDTAGHYFDMKTGAMDPTKGPLPASEMSPPLALIEDTGITCLPLYFEIYDFLRSIPGHKFVVADSCYNLLNFTGQTKINETSVKAALNLLDYLCAATDSTMIYLWHPSQSGMDRGDASGWSVAWNNTPRARLSLSKVENNANAFNLKVEKRNNGPAGQIITLHWSDGVLLPMSAVDLSTQAETFFEACVAAALKAAEHGSAIQKQKRIAKWIMDYIEEAVGKTPTDREVKDQLAAAVGKRRLRYINGYGKQIAGYYPWTTDAPTMRLIGVDTAKEAQQRGGVEYGVVPNKVA